MMKRAVPRTKRHLHSSMALGVRALLVFATVVLFAACTAPFNASIIDDGEDDQSTTSGEGSEPDDTDLGVTEITLDSPSDLEAFFDDESTTQLSENVTITAAVSGGSNHRWWVDGVEVTEGAVPHVEVESELNPDPDSLTIFREHADFESTYPIGTTIKVILVVDVDGETYSGSHNFEVIN